MGRVYREDRSDYWYMDYIDRNQKRVRKSSGHRDKAQALICLKNTETNERHISQGLAPDDSAAEKLLVVDQLNKFATSQKTQAGENYIEDTRRMILAVAEHQGWKMLSDISDEGIEAFIEHLSEQGRSARNKASHITAVRTFCRWCVKRKKLLTDPTASVKKPSSSSDRRIERRMLLPEEWQKLREHLQTSDENRNGQPAGQRLIMYWTAIETGLRSNELRQLRVGDCKLSGEPHILARASTTKNAKTAKQYVGDALAKQLRKLVKGRGKAEPLFSVRDRTIMARELRRDCKRAKIECTNELGEVIDFHALRHTTGAWLAMAGLSLPEIQAAMRHSTIKLTIDEYGHLHPDAAAKNRNALATFTTPS